MASIDYGSTGPIFPWDDNLTRPTQDSSRPIQFGLRRYEIRQSFYGATEIVLDLMCFGRDPRAAIERLLNILNAPGYTEATLEERVKAEVSSMSAALEMVKKERDDLKAEVAYWKGAPIKRILPDDKRQIDK